MVDAPRGSVGAVWNWGAEGLSDAWNGVEGAWEDNGLAGAAGVVAGLGVDLLNPFRKAKAAGEAADALGDIGDATRTGGATRRRRRGEDREEEDGRDGARSTREKPYRDTTSRPKYAPGQVDSVWENAKDRRGNVYDPNTGEKLEWDRSRSRSGQWDMGHKPGHEYRKLHKDYIDGKISKEKSLDEYRNPKNYQPESVSGIEAIDSKRNDYD
ncbi:MAG: HNH/ENDO VII family nuclease [Paracoccus sp. (in: a-proteobacteria)]|uniref:HNH/ENDO VII family nuclease n=1 Tax=Paracoccus sp. TaxID=267 RepID=UPI0026DEA443|nr:HNH/ENDO VII family nuclease [Paracoccus sp. (in: a-proteobacteria)]MDO5612457.1 HNH/ENDO VII family nuclease [Paracoccus sp. (in: a-proteobacteria)]